jgi:hypothetical protein
LGATARHAVRRISERHSWALPLISALGFLICAVQIAQYVRAGVWPFHDTADFWFAGRRLLEGSSVYASNPEAYLVFPYAPPWAVLLAPVSLLPLDVVCGLLLLAQVAALRNVAGSWLVVGLLCWLPVVPRALMTGNIDFLVGAAILAGIRGAGWPVALFSFAKIAPAVTLLGATRRQWIEAATTAALLVLLTVPWWHLWGEWLALIVTIPPGTEDVVPIFVRLPIALVLLAARRPWALAAAAGLLTPSFHVHTPVLLFPALRLWWEARWRPVGAAASGVEPTA